MNTKKINFSKLLTFIVATLMVATIALALSLADNNSTAFAVENYHVNGGRLVYDFDDGKLDDFKLYSEFGNPPHIINGKLYCWVLAEQKVILKNRQYSDVEVNVDIMTINESGKFDSGIYVQASDAYSDLDAIYGWCVSLERGADQTTYYLMLHRFEDSWIGVKKEVDGLKLPMNKVHLRVVVKSGYLFAFVDNHTEPDLTYYIGTDAGSVGLRCNYAPNYFDNFTVIGQGNEYDYSLLSPSIEKAQSYNIDELTKESGDILAVALENALAVKSSVATQYEVDEVAQALADALAQVEYKRAFTELTDTIQTAKAIANPNGKTYTKNSWNSLQEVIDICEALTEDSGETLISYWTNRLEYRISALVPYLTEV